MRIWICLSFFFLISHVRSAEPVRVGKDVLAGERGVELVKALEQLSKYRDVLLLKKSISRPAEKKLQPPDSEIKKKLKPMVIRRISFEDAPLDKVIHFLRRATKKLSSDGKGVNFHLFLDRRAKPQPRDGNFTDDDDDFGDDDFGDDDDDDGLEKQLRQKPTVTMEFTNIPFLDALRFMCEQSRCRYKFTGNAVEIYGPNLDDEDELVYERIPIDPRLFTGGGDDDDDGGDVDHQEFFEQKGVSFATTVGGARPFCYYDRGVSVLIFRVTPSNLRLLKRILAPCGCGQTQMVLGVDLVEFDRPGEGEKERVIWRFGAPVRQGNEMTADIGMPGLENEWCKYELTATGQLTTDGKRVGLDLSWTSEEWSAKSLAEALRTEVPQGVPGQKVNTKLTVECGGKQSMLVRSSSKDRSGLKLVVTANGMTSFGCPWHVSKQDLPGRTWNVLKSLEDAIGEDKSK